MNSKGQIVYLFTAQFPYGSGETFLENELPELNKYFKSIIIVPFHQLGERRNISNDLVTFSISDNKKQLSISQFYELLYCFFVEFFLTNRKWHFLRSFKYHFSLLKKAILTASYLEEKGLCNSHDFYYSFWLNDWALALAILKRRKRITTFVFRSGGFDIWNERYKGNYLPFRGFVYKYADRIYPNTKVGERYLKNIGIFPEKIKFSYWGTKDFGMGPLPFEKTFRIVSCSSMIPLKRVHLILEVLQYSKLKLDWIHFGDGPLRIEIEQKAMSLPSSIHWEFRGNVSNMEILEFYRKTPVDLFITTSETEGLPVSIQEAISFGIPVAATNVGGIPEIVDSDIGVLFEKEFKPKMVAEFIDELLVKFRGQIELRERVREKWEKSFKAEVVYEIFAKDILNLKS